MPVTPTKVIQSVTIYSPLAEMSREAVKVDTGGSRQNVWVRQEGVRGVIIGKIIANEGKRFQAYGLRDGAVPPNYTNADDGETLIFLGDFPKKMDAKDAIVKRAIAYRDTVYKSKNLPHGRDFASAGEARKRLKSWRGDILSFADNVNAVVAVAAQFIGPLMKRFFKSNGWDSQGLGGIHFIGDKRNTNQIKLLSESIWGRDYSFSWGDFIAYEKSGKNKYDNDHSTALLEAAMSQASDAGCVIHSGEKSDYLTLHMYLAMSGGDFCRTDRDLRIIDPIHFRVFVVSFGLKSPTQQVVDAGEKSPLGGIMGRVLSIPVPNSIGLNPDIDKRLHASSGIAGKVFVEHFHDLGSNVPDYLSQDSINKHVSEMREFIGSIPLIRPDTVCVQTDDRFIHRLVYIYLAGRLAYDLGVLPISPHVIMDSVKACAVNALNDMDQNMPASCHHPDSIPLSQRSQI